MKDIFEILRKNGIEAHKGTKGYPPLVEQKFYCNLFKTLILYTYTFLEFVAFICNRIPQSQ